MDNTSVNTMNKIYEEYFEEYLQLYPVTATSIGDYRYNDQMPIRIGDEFRNRFKEFYQKYLKLMSSVDRKDLAGQDRISYDMFKQEIQIKLEGLKYYSHLIPINQFGCEPISFAEYGSGESTVPFKTVKHYDDFLKRIKMFSQWVDTAIVNMNKGIELGIVQPKILIEKAIPIFQNTITEDITKSNFYRPIHKLPADFDQKEKDRLTKLYTDAIKNEINPAYQKLLIYLKNEYLPKCRTSIGLSDLPDGKNYYAYLVKMRTTSDKTPDEIFQIGLDEIARIKKQMEEIKEQVSFKGDLKEFFVYMRSEPKFYYTNKEDLLNGYRNIRVTVESNLSKLFGIKDTTKLEIRPVPELTEKTAAGAYYVDGTEDGSRPGVFYANTYDLKSAPKYSMESSFLHEAIPGHHYQISIAHRVGHLPRFRKFAWTNAYGEGWALYAESLGKELGLYKDPYSYYGRLSNEIFRAIRLVVDVGIHAKGWTRDEAIKFMTENSSSGKSDIGAEIDRYISWPGQALAYKMGELKIMEMRAKCEKQLGDKFDIRAFHDEIIKDGAIPLDILETKMQEYVDAQLK
jgi:uncharacterized protein (DUF885 family)